MIFQRNSALERLGLLGHEDDAHATFTDLLQQLVGSDDGAGAFGDWRKASCYASRFES